MNLPPVILFAATVFPLVCTPGPDLLYIASQGMAGGRVAAVRANLGVILGYAAHAVLAAFGVAALVAASPMLFQILRWVGVAYLAYLAMQMLHSAMQSGPLTVGGSANGKASLSKGFLTSFLNPKGLLVYFAILPNFMNAHDEIAMKALILSGVFIGLCAIVYGVVGLIAASVARAGTFGEKKRRLTEGTAGSLLALAAFNMARS